MTTLREAAQQALEALDAGTDVDPIFAGETEAALRAALAQQKDPTDPGNDVDVLREHVRHLERRVRQLHAQQAEPVQEQDPELSAALGWPGGISDPVLDRKVLLQMVAALMQDKFTKKEKQ